MATPSIREVVEHLCAWADAGSLADLPDAQLLERFLNQREEAAFAALLLRHGPMVLHVCRRMLGNIHDAEDVFQATFLMLARKARSIRKRDAVGSWLHGVAHRLSVRVREQARRRQVHEQQAANLHRTEPTLEAAWSEVQAVLDEELRRLPAKYRAVLVLCYLEGKTQEEAARHLGCPLGTVRSRLARARSLFQKRLVRRGLALSGAALASALLAQTASATVPITLLRHTLKAASAFAAGRAVGSEISAQVVLLAEGGLKAMSAAKLKLALTMTVATLALSAGAGALAVHVWADKSVPAKQEISPKAAAEKPVAPKQAAEPIDHKVHEGDALPAGAIRRLGSLRFRHVNGASWMPTAFSRDGKWLATCNGNIRLWDWSTGALIREIEGHYRGGIFSPDGKALATVEFYVTGDRQSLCLLDVATGKILHRLPAVRVYAFSPDGKLLATNGPASELKGGNTYSVSLWDTATGRQISVLRGQHTLIHSAAFTPDGRTLVTACYRNRVCRWDVARGELRKSFDLPLREGREGRLSPDGSTLLVASPRVVALQSDDVDSLWDTETGRIRCTLPTRRGEHDYGLAFSPDGKILATNSTEAGTDQKTIFLWDVGTAKRVGQFKVPARVAFVLTFAPDGKTLLSSGEEPLVRLWDTATGKQLFTETDHTGAIAALAFTRDGRTLVSGADDGTLRVWDIAAARLSRPLLSHRGCVYTLAVAPDGKTVLSGGAEGCLRLHDLDTGELRRRFAIDKPPPELRQPEYHVVSLALAADGRTAASWSATDMREHALFHIWDLATGKALVRRSDSSGRVLQLFSPDAKLVLSCNDTEPSGSFWSSGRIRPLSRVSSTVVLGDVATGREILPLPQPDNHGYVQEFAPDGRTLVTATGKLRAFPTHHHTLHLWELATGKERLTIAPGKTGWEYEFKHIAFTPDGRTFATVRGDGTIQLWDVATGAELLSRLGYGRGVNCLVFSPDSLVLACGYADSTILLWDVISGRRAPRQPIEKSRAGQLERWWNDLAGEDACKAHAAIWGLCAVPERAMKLFRERLRPAPAVPGDKIRQRIADLDSDEFQRREAASAELAALGDQAHAALQAALQANPSVEQRKRIETLLADPGRVRSAETLRHLRAVEVLERIASPEARQILDTLSQGARAARQTREAKAALTRLSRL